MSLYDAFAGAFDARPLVIPKGELELVTDRDEKVAKLQALACHPNTEPAERAAALRAVERLSRSRLCH